METHSKEKIETKKHKGGRPTKAIKRSSSLVVRLTPTERLLKEGKAREAGLRPTAWFRAAAKRAKVVQRLRQEDMQILRMLYGLANNLNQLTRLAHKEGLLLIQRKCVEILKEISDAITYFNSDDRKSNDR